MNDANLRVDGTLSLNNQNYLHIKKVEVFTGDDDYNETDLIEVESVGLKLIAKKTITEGVKPNPYRLRGEPGIRLVIESEDESIFVLTIAHHKGSIHINAKEINHEMV